MLEYRYDPPFKFSGKIDKLTFKLKLEPEPSQHRSASRLQPLRTGLRARKDWKQTP